MADTVEAAAKTTGNLATQAITGVTGEFQKFTDMFADLNIVGFAMGCYDCKCYVKFNTKLCN